MSRRKTLFIFTKHYPFGTAEQYIADEQEYLAEKFEQLVFVPCEVFEEKQMNTRREIPGSAEILLLNQKTISSRSKSRKWGEMLSVFFGEWFRAENKRWFWKERKRYISVLAHQAACATTFGELLNTDYKDAQCCFYTYWIHNSTVMLGLMKRRGDISDYVTRGHSIDLYDWAWTTTKTVGHKVLPFYNFNIHQAPGIFPVSDHGELFLRKKFPQFADKIKSFHLGVPDCGNNPFDATCIFTVVSCGNMHLSKGIHRIPALLELMGMPVRWIHFGNDGNGTEQVHAEIQKLSPQVKVDLRGFTPNAEIKSFYSKETIHLFLSLSEVEGVPVSIMEAISFGIPVLGTEVYGTPEVANEKTGFSVPYSSTPEFLASIVKKFAGDHSAQLQIRRSAKEYFTTNFLASHNYRTFASELLLHLNP